MCSAMPTVLIQNIENNNIINSNTHVLDDNAKRACLNVDISDVTFVVGKNSKEFPAIGGIFAMHSKYFRDILFGGEQNHEAKQEERRDVTMMNQQRRVTEQDVTELAFEFIYKYVYRLYPDIIVDNVVDVLHAAGKYCLTHLAEDCKAFIHLRLKTNNINEILSIQSKAIGFKLEYVMKAFSSWLTVETSLLILESNALSSPSISQELIINLIQNNSFSVNEKHIWSSCRKWCEMTDKSNWTTLMVGFVPHIRFTLMEQSFFAQHVYPTNVLKIEESMKISLFHMNPTSEVRFAFSTEQRVKVDYAHNERYTLLQRENQELRDQLEAYKNAVTYKNAQCLQYILKMSSKYDGTLNSYEALTNNNVNEGVATSNLRNNKMGFEYVAVEFNNKVNIFRMDIAGLDVMHSDDTKQNVSEIIPDVPYINNRQIQYKGDDGNWLNWKIFTDLKQNEIRTLDVNIETCAMRIVGGRWSQSPINISIGCWRFYGNNA